MFVYITVCIGSGFPFFTFFASNTGNYMCMCVWCAMHMYVLRKRLMHLQWNRLSWDRRKVSFLVRCPDFRCGNVRLESQCVQVSTSEGFHCILHVSHIPETFGGSLKVLISCYKVQIQVYRYTPRIHVYVHCTCIKRAVTAIARPQNHFIHTNLWNACYND